MTVGSRTATAESGGGSGTGAYSRPTTAEPGTTGATYSVTSSSSRPSTAGGGDSITAYPVGAAIGANDDGQLAQHDHAVEVAEATGQHVLARTPPPLIDQFLDAVQQVERDEHGYREGEGHEEGKLDSPIMSAPFSPESTAGKSFAELQGDSSPLSTSTESNAPSSPMLRSSDDFPPPPRADLEPAAFMTAASMAAAEEAAPVPPPVPPRVAAPSSQQQQAEPALRRPSSASATKPASASTPTPTPAISTMRAAAASSKLPALGQASPEPSVFLGRNSYLSWQFRSGRLPSSFIQDLTREERAVDQ
ncbi:hypothetical protein H9P43_002868 [Blastocladiella emersonii ATCC 22665]|nr:hypothetical protein H9P43_002868 [Blastocladiella emersonii ATCC 22665]